MVSYMSPSCKVCRFENFAPAIGYGAIADENILSIVAKSQVLKTVRSACPTQTRACLTVTAFRKMVEGRLFRLYNKRGTV